jgi:hypothetical protein
MQPPQQPQPAASIDGVHAWTLDPGTELIITINPVHEPEPLSTRAEAAWNDLRRAYPRLHDGPILAVERADPRTARLDCRIDSYKRLVTQRETAVWMLGVKGWGIGAGPEGEPHLLTARRGSDTRIYGGMWENAPAGGVDPPPPGRTRVPADWLIQTLTTEAQEELGIAADWQSARPIILLRDDNARSYDIILGVTLPGTIDPAQPPRRESPQRAWEYTDSAWLPRNRAPALLRSNPDSVSPPMKASLLALGWA